MQGIKCDVCNEYLAMCKHKATRDEAFTKARIRAEKINSKLKRSKYYRNRYKRYK